MNDDRLELQSRLLDGEIGGGERESTIDALLTDPDAMERFGRYRAIGDALRGEFVAGASQTARRVSAALEDEPVVLTPRSRGIRWQRPVAGAALAASVAAAAVYLTPQLISVDEPSPLGPQIAERGSASPAKPPKALFVAEVAKPAAAPRWQALDATLRERLNRLVIEHHEFGGRTGINGPVAHTSLVNYESR